MFDIVTRDVYKPQSIEQCRIWREEGKPDCLGIVLYGCAFNETNLGEIFCFSEIFSYTQEGLHLYILQLVCLSQTSNECCCCRCKVCKVYEFLFLTTNKKFFLTTNKKFSQLIILKTKKKTQSHHYKNILFTFHPWFRQSLHFLLLLL